MIVLKDLRLECGIPQKKGLSVGQLELALHRFLACHAASIISHPARTTRLQLTSLGANARHIRSRDAFLVHKNLHLECGTPLPPNRLKMNL
jgi:hypothetical protein